MPSDAEIVKAVRAALIRAGIFRDPFPEFAKRHPEWDRERWDRAMGAMDGPARGPGRGLGPGRSAENQAGSGCSVGLEALTGELQGPAVLGDCADDVVGGSRGDLGLDFEGDGDLGADDSGEVGDDLIGEDGVPGEILADGLVEVGQAGLVGGEEDEQLPFPGLRVDSPRMSLCGPGWPLRTGGM